MRKILLSMLIVIVLCVSAYSLSLASDEYSVGIHIDCLENLIFSKYDVDVYLEDEFLTRISHGDEYSGTIHSEVGVKHLYFYNHDDHDIKGALEFNVLDNTKLDCIIGCHGDQVSINSYTVDTEEVLLNIEEVLPLVPEKYKPEQQESLAAYENSLAEAVTKGVLTYRQANTLLNYAQEQQKWASEDSISFVRSIHGKTTTIRRYHLIISFSAKCAVLVRQEGGRDYEYKQYGKVSGNLVNGFMVYWEDGTLDDYIVGTNQRGSTVLLLPNGVESGFAKCSDYPTYFHIFDNWSYASGYDPLAESTVESESYVANNQVNSEKSASGSDTSVESEETNNVEDEIEEETGVSLESTIRIILDKKEVAIPKGKSVKLNAEIVGLPEGEPIPKIEWNTSDKAIVTCANGTIKAVKAGNALITCSCLLTDGTTIMEECAVLVIVPVSSITANPKSINLSCGERFTLVFAIKPENASVKDLDFASSKPEIR